MSCTYIGEPIRARRMQFALGTERTYGEYAADQMATMLLYNVDSLIQPAGNVVSSAEVDALTTETLPIGSTYDLKGSVYLYGSGTAIQPPKWMDLLSAFGFIRDSPSEYPYARYIPTVLPRSVSVLAWYEDLKHVALGCRGTYTITGAAGNPVEMSFALRGLYQDRTEENCEFESPVSVLPPRLIDAHFSINQNGVDRTSPCKGFVIEGGGKIEERAEYTEDGSPSEILLPSPLDPTWEITVEVKHGFDWTEVYRNKRECSLSITVGQDVGSQIRFRTPLSNARLAGPPTYGNSNGALTQTARFQLLGKEYLEIVHT